MILGSLKKFKKQIPEVLKPRSKDTRRTSGNTTRNDSFPQFLIIEAQTQVIEQVAVRSGMDSKMAELDCADELLIVSFLALSSDTVAWGYEHISKLEYKFQDKENSEDIFSFGSALEDFISVVFVHDRNIFANDHVAGNGVGFTQLALFGGGMYFELFVYIPEASTLGFSEAVDPPLFLPRNSVFSLAFSAVKAFSFSVFKFKNFSVFPIACRSKIFAKAIFELGTTISEKANTPDPRYGPSMETNMRHLTSHRCLLGCRTCLVFRYLFNAIPIGENHRPLHYPIMANSDG
ncbi:hypothetical protein Tco_0809569 [Tanacetum coccineum]